MTPILNNVVVRPAKSDEVSTGGIYVPESAQERSSRATIVAYGDGSKRFPLKFPEDIIPNDECVHIKGAGVEIMIDGVKHYIIKSQDILAFLK